MKKYLISAIQFLRKSYYFIVRPNTKWVRLILIKKSKVLLVKHTYDDQLYIPWWWIKKNEDLIVALIREINEELSIDLRNQKNQFKLLWVYKNNYEYKNDTIYVYVLNWDFINFDSLSSKSIEIENFSFYDITKLPNNTSPWSKRRISEFLKWFKTDKINKW